MTTPDTASIAIIGDIHVLDINGAHHPGGSAAIALAAAEHGARVTLHAAIGNDSLGQEARTALRNGRVHPGKLLVTEGRTAFERLNDAGNVVFRQPGVGIQMGAVLDVYSLFAHDALVLDVQDASMRRFISDLPAHTDGKVNMIGTLRHLDWVDPEPDELDIALRYDTVIGTVAHYHALTGLNNAEDAVGTVWDGMDDHHLRSMVVLADDGFDIITPDERQRKPIDGGNPDALLPYATAIIALGTGRHVAWDAIANAIVGVSE